MADPNLNEGVDAARAQRTAGTSLISSQKAENADYLNRYKGALAGQETQTAASQRLSGELGLDKARGAATTLNTQINNLPGVLKTASQGRDINANQLQRLTAARLAPIQANYANATSLQSSLEGQLGQRLGLELADQQKALMPYQTEQSLLQSSQGNEMGLFTAANANELGAIQSKIAAGVQISEGEKNRAHQLEMQKQAAADQRALQESQGGSNPFMTLSEGQTLYNTQTGAPVYTANKTKAPSAASGPRYQTTLGQPKASTGGWG